jgi:two-component system cell cycle sensor histidine kinase/response regulator CckA
LSYTDWVHTLPEVQGKDYIRHTMSKALRALFVEDSERDAELLLYELEESGYLVTHTRVQTAEAMKAALESASWDVVFSDYSMPTFNAMGALDVLKASGLDLPFIIVSGTIGEETAVAALKAGAHDFLVKARLARLIPALERELRDVCVRRERLQLEDRLRQSQKMEGIGRLAGGIAHDFNNILTTIGGYSEMILEQIGADKPISADLVEIRTAVDRAAQLTRQLLAFSRQQVFRIEELDLREVVRGMQSMLQRLIGEDVVVKLILPDRLQPLRADRVQLEQVLMNIAANARDAMPKGGRFTIATSIASAEAVVGITGLPAADGDYVQLTMSDSGTGMDARTRERLFEPFFTTKELGKGTGLGMATVYGIVQQLGGYIAVSSEVGKGTTFTLFFPASAATEIKPRATPAALPAPAPLATEREVVLLVEDETGVRNLVARTLKRHGYRVIEAGSATEGLRLAAQHDGRIHLVLSDVVMPFMRGPEMVKQLQAVRPGIKTLYMSGHPGQGMTTEGVLDPSEHLLEKPFASHDLLRAVRELLDS